MDINNTSITIEQLAYKIKKLKLETPALLFLEMHKPLTSLLHHGTVFFAPLVAPLFGLKRYSKIQTLLADRNNIEQLIKKLTT
ncbi:MAG: hypothetical protein LBE20_01145 [Deltaproteobacteria bacterium]|nr:hypothetical protein [Deltaproteobacteria bacterium]